MQLKIHSCGIYDCAPSWYWNTHANGFLDYDLWAVFRGNGHICAHTPDRFETDVHEGTVLLLSPNIHYTASHNSKSPLLVIGVHFDFLDTNGQPLFAHKLAVKHIQNADFFRTLLTRTVTCFHSGQLEKATAFFQAAVAEYESADEFTFSPAGERQERMIHEIRTEISVAKKIPSLGDFSARYGYSERYVGKLFAQKTGSPFSVYVRNVQLSKAKTLLRHSDLPIHIIAEEVGFYDACHFSRVFRTATGISPFAYRKKDKHI